ncbi:MAG: hypothetical protein HC929_01450 [Leptolyngbyaceae cyanobacterium SM2_5_2]|nr:hypothetical protein [Leptolyngbyaceae cyanobacterium SM2_5_2]
MAWIGRVGLGDRLLWPSSSAALAQLPQAATKLTALPHLAQATLPAANEGRSLERMGQNYYAEGEFQSALSAFQQAAQDYAASGQLIRQAISLGNVSLTHQQLGQWPEAVQAIGTALNLVNTELERAPSRAGQSALAQVLDIQGHLQLAQGNAEQALKTWEQSAMLYRHLNDPERLGNSLINQTSALRALGLYQRALVIVQQALGNEAPTVPLLEELGPNPLESLNQRLQVLPKTLVTANALRNLGDTLQIAGSLKQAQVVLAHSLALAESLGLPERVAQAHLSLGNVIQTQALADLRPYKMAPAIVIAFLQEPRDLIDAALARRSLAAAQQFEQQMELALQHYQQAAVSRPPVQFQAQLSRLKLLLVLQQWAAADVLAAELSRSLTALPPGPTALAAQLNLAQSLMDMAQSSHKAVAPLNQRRAAADLLAQARQQRSPSKILSKKPTPWG